MVIILNYSDRFLFTLLPTIKYLNMNVQQQIEVLKDKIEKTSDFSKKLELKDELLELEVKAGKIKPCSAHQEACESCSG